MMKMLYEQTEGLLRMPVNKDNLELFLASVEEFQQYRVYGFTKPAHNNSKGKGPMLGSGDAEETVVFITSVAEDPSAISPIRGSVAPAFEEDPLISLISDTEGDTHDETDNGLLLETFDFTIVSPDEVEAQRANAASLSSFRARRLIVSKWRKLKPWTSEELKVFYAYYEFFGPSFELIASYLHHRSVEDVKMLFDISESHLNKPFNEGNQVSVVVNARLFQDQRVYIFSSDDSDNSEKKSANGGTLPDYVSLDSEVGYTMDGVIIAKVESSDILKWRKVSPWTVFELERLYGLYDAFGCSFELIASYLDNRTVGMVKMLYDINEKYLSKPSSERSLTCFQFGVDLFQRQTVYSVARADAED